MLKAFACLSAVVAILSLAGCATVTRGTSEAFVVESDPVGAEVRLSNGLTCKTPCSLKLKRKDGFTVHVTKDGYEPVESTIVAATANSGAAGMAGNVLLGGLIGAAVDSGNGSMNELKPNPLQVKLVKLADTPALNTGSVASNAPASAPKDASTPSEHAKAKFTVASMSGAGAYGGEEIKGDPIYSYGDGDTVAVVEKGTDGRWFKVLLPDGRTGYVASALIKTTYATDARPETASAEPAAPVQKAKKTKKKPAPPAEPQQAAVAPAAAPPPSNIVPAPEPIAQKASHVAQPQ